MAPRTRAGRCGLLCLVPADTCRLLVVTVTVLCPAAMGLLLPFGTSQGDARSQSDWTSSPAVSLSTPFVFYGNQYSTLRAINDGFVSFTADDADIYDVGSDFTDVVIAAVCVFCSDIIPGTSGSVWNRLTTDRVALLTIQNVTQEYQEFGSTFTPSWAFVVTWDRVVTYQYTGPGNTMQAILASNGNTSLVILQYDIISWVNDGGFSKTAINTKVGFNKGDGTQFYLFPVSKATALFNLTVTSNTGSPGLFLFRVDVTTISPTLTKTTTTVPTTAPTTTTAAARTATSVTTTAAETTTTGIITIQTTTTVPATTAVDTITVPTTTTTAAETTTVNVTTTRTETTIVLQTTTAAPTTSTVPNTAVPTTTVLTTAVPTTAVATITVPTTAVPTTTVPTTAVPTTTVLTTAVPTTAVATTTVPTTAVPTTTVPTTAVSTTTVRTTAVHSPNSAVQTTAYNKVAPFPSNVTIILICYTGIVPVSKGRPFSLADYCPSVVQSLATHGRPPLSRAKRAGKGRQVSSRVGQSLYVWLSRARR